MNKPWYDKFKIEVEDDEQSIPVRIGVLCASEALSESARGFLHSPDTMSGQHLLMMRRES